jgi:hypothetical protein
MSGMSIALAKGTAWGRVFIYDHGGRGRICGRRAPQRAALRPKGRRWFAEYSGKHPGEQISSICEAQMQRYAWLEYDNSMWHLLADLSADPEESARRWLDRQDALSELMAEGWIMISRHPSGLTSRETGEEVYVYGFGRTAH